MKKLWYLAVLCVLVLASCDPAEVEPDGEFKSGVFVANQGQFPNGAGAVTFIDRDSLLAKQSIFESVNGRQLGSVVQSITIHEDRAYIIVNNANLVEVADAETFEEVGVIENVVMPRYFVGIDENKGYLSGWGDNGTAGYVKVIDLSTLSVTKTINTGSGTERMKKLGDAVFAVNSGGFGKDSTLVILDTDSDDISQTIELTGFNPNSLQLDANDALWILCKGISDWNNPSNNVNGRLIKMNSITYAEESSWELLGADGLDMVIDKAGSTLFYNFFGSVYSQDVNSSALDNNVFANRYFYGLGFDPVTNYLYAADAGDFASDGQIFRYNVNGSVVDSFSVGVVPGNFTFTE
jgi:DNA-binding beta-propeller fold protein YncE